MKDYTKLKELLETEETFPHRFLFKFIGRNTPTFLTGVAALTRANPALQLVSTRKSSNDQHVSLSYEYEAAEAEAIIEIYRAIQKIEDLLIVL
jgi:putative lipoic acid-binding regulatory protein